MSPVSKKPVSLREAAPTSAAAGQRAVTARSGQQALALGEIQAAPVRAPAATRSVAAAEPGRLWFCIHLPHLPLEAGAAGSGARVVVEEQHGIHRVLLADAGATAAGIMPGQSLNAALALLPTLDIVERSRLSEQQALETLATWLEQFSSLVCLAGPDVLLLEIAGSLRLYGGLPSLRQRIATGLRQQGFNASSAIAPTPLAATWLARCGHRVCIREPGNLAAALRRVSVACLDWPVAVCESLAGMGIRSIGDCLRLPREGFARRFGPERLLEIDRALGRLPDPRSGWRAPQRFCADHDMLEEQSDRELLLAVCHELLRAHERFLLARQLGTQRVLFSFFHLRGYATQLPLGCSETARLADHWFDLLRIRFERLTLPEPVLAVRLQGGRTQPLRAESGRLALRGRTGSAGPCRSILQLSERLAARVGKQSVGGVATVAEHRPQLAWCWRELGNDKTARSVSMHDRRSPRPLWMLPEPALLRADAGIPLHQGPLTLLEGPERLETGWWDEHGIARDYYRAVNPHGMHLWVFRNRSREASCWYLHGFFG
jgi:protein ImuB